MYTYSCDKKKRLNKTKEKNLGKTTLELTF